MRRGRARARARRKDCIDEGRTTLNVFFLAAANTICMDCIRPACIIRRLSFLYQSRTKFLKRLFHASLLNPLYSVLLH